MTRFYYVVILEISEANEVQILKQQNIIISESLKVGQVVDGYTLQKSLIQND
jgi:hypothetical protein